MFAIHFVCCCCMRKRWYQHWAEITDGHHVVTVLFSVHSASGASVVAIDNKIEQAMDLVKSHLMYAVREEVEVLKEQIKELYERNSVLERENAVLKSLANSEQLTQLSSQLSPASSVTLPQLQHQHSLTTNSSALGHYVAVQSVPHQPNITSAWPSHPPLKRTQSHTF